MRDDGPAMSTTPRRQPWEGQPLPCSQPGSLRPSGHLRCASSHMPKALGCANRQSVVTFPSHRAASVLCRLLRAETGVGPDLKLGKLILAWNLLGKQGADNGCQEPDGNADEGRVF